MSHAPRSPRTKAPSTATATPAAAEAADTRRGAVPQHTDAQRVAAHEVDNTEASRKERTMTSEKQNQVDIYEVFLLAYRQNISVKEFRQAVMEVARESKNAPLKAAMMQLIPNMSNAKLATIMDNTARLKADVIRHQLSMLRVEGHE